MNGIVFSRPRPRPTVEEASTPSALRAYALGFLLLLGLQALSGLVLVTMYDPDPDEAHSSVRRIHEGPVWLLASLHVWMAEALLIAGLAAGAFAVANRVDLLAPHRWFAGATLLGALFLFYLSGGILAWDQQGWESYQHVAMAFGQSPASPTEARLAWVLAVHALALPAVVLLALWGGERTGIVRWSRADARALLRRRPAWALGAGILVLSVFLPPFFGPAPITGLAVSRPDWPFLWLVPLQDRFGTAALWMLPILGLLVVSSRKLLSRLSPRGRMLLIALAGLVVGILTLLALVP